MLKRITLLLHFKAGRFTSKNGVRFFSMITHVTYQKGENLIDKYKGYDF